jgi:hypothetical protein
VGDPVGSGFVAALNQPGGNITGFAVFEASSYRRSWPPVKGRGIPNLVAD